MYTGLSLKERKLDGVVEVGFGIEVMARQGELSPLYCFTRTHGWRGRKRPAMSGNLKNETRPRRQMTLLFPGADGERSYYMGTR